MTQSVTEGLRQRLALGDSVIDEAGSIRITVPIQLRTWGGETVIEGPNGAPATADNHTDANLIAAVVKAHQWKEALAAGKASSFRVIARKDGCTEGYVRQIVELAFLAPEITAAILRGAQPRHLTVDRLVRRPIPLSWKRQRLLFGVAA